MQEIGASFLYFDFSGHVLDVNFGVNVGETCVIEYSEDRTKREVDPRGLKCCPLKVERINGQLALMYSSPEINV